MIFLRRETFKGYLRSYPGIVAIVAICFVYYAVTALGGYLSQYETVNVAGEMVSVPKAYNAGAMLTIPGLDPFGLEKPWHYLTSMFMHANFYHIFHNMVVLIIFGPPLERLLKTKRFVPFYILCGIGGSFIAALINSARDIPTISVGASGAVYGILGAYLFMALFRQRMLDPSSKQTIYMMLIIGVVSSIIVSNISLEAHLGGLLTGLLVYRLFDQLVINKK